MTEHSKLLEHVIEIKHSLGGLEAKIDSLDEKIERHLNDDRVALQAIDKRLGSLESESTESVTYLNSIKPTVVQHDKRLNSVERKQSWMTGVGSAITFAITSALLWMGGHK